jgi:CheY-like chemotaxis protein
MDGSILIVDDEASELAHLHNMLVAAGHEVVAVTDPLAAVDSLREQDFQVIVAGQRVPDSSGLEFLGEMRELFPATMRVLVTAATESAAVVAAMNEGVVHRCVFKPILHTHVTALVAECVATHYQNQEQQALRDALSHDQSGGGALYRRVLDALPVPVVAIAANNKVVYANPELRRAFPSLASVEVGKALTDYLSAGVMAAIHYCIDNDMPTVADPVELDHASVQVSVATIRHDASDWIVITLNELYPLFSKA